MLERKLRALLRITPNQVAGEKLQRVIKRLRLPGDNYLERSASIRMSGRRAGGGRV